MNVKEKILSIRIAESLKHTPTLLKQTGLFVSLPVQKKINEFEKEKKGNDDRQ